MDKEIKYLGLTTRPSDYNAPDGDLAVSLNLINKDGALHPVAAPKILHNYGDYQVVYIHKTSVYTHYILADNSIYAWVDSKDMDTVIPLHTFTKDTPFSITSNGNTLIVTTANGMHYLRFVKGSYQHIGNHLPELQLSFGLQGYTYLDSVFTIDVRMCNIRYNDLPFIEGGKYIFTNEQKNVTNIFTSAVLAKANKFVADHSGNRFVFPFLVRYAFRLFDGTLSMHSAPVLMVTNSAATPRAFITSYLLDGSDDDTEKVLTFDCRIGGIDYDLDVQFIDDLDIVKTQLEQWKDIIRSVDIFVSAPLYSYNQAESVQGIALNTREMQGYTIAKFPQQSVPDNDYLKRWTAPLIISDYGTGTRGKLEFILPQFNDDSDNIGNVANFYLLKSLTLDEIYAMTTRSVIDIPKNYLKTLLQYERMTDDYDSHDTIIPQHFFNFNNRLFISNITKILANPNGLASYVSYNNVSIVTVEGQTTAQSTNFYVYVFVRQDDIEYVVSSETSVVNINVGSFCPIAYFYYPNPNAYKVVLVDANDTQRRFEFQLKRHDFLNGAFFFNGWDSDIMNDRSRTPDFPTASSDRSILLPNKIYTSEVNNPYNFPVTSINTVGTGAVIGMATVTEPLSQGQFGFADIYIFTTEGIWVAKINQEGKINNINTFTGDVCTDPKSITQLSKSVLFVSERGIMLIAGSAVSCISDTISGMPFDFSILPKYNQLLSKAQFSYSDVYYKNFLSFLKNCQIVYDYTNQRIIVFNPTLDGNDNLRFSYAYVYSLESQLWGTMQSNFKSTINSYPDALAVDVDNNLISFSDDDDTVTNGMIVSRPFKLDNPDALKSVHSVIQRGLFQQGDVSLALYGSRDLYSWHLIGSSATHKLRHYCGSPYKYFRIVALTTLSVGKSLSGISVDFSPRHLNQLY